MHGRCPPVSRPWTNDLNSSRRQLSLPIEPAGADARRSYGDWVHELAGARARAYLIDCGVYLAVAAATAPFGVLAHVRGWGKRRSFVLAASTIPPLVATVIAARQESGPHAATFGKRRQGLVVCSRDGVPVTFGQGLIRNTVKIGIPWQLGHVVAVGAAFGGFDDADPLTLGATVLTYPLVGAMVTAGSTGSGRALHDRLVGTVVKRVTLPS